MILEIESGWHQRLVLVGSTIWRLLDTCVIFLLGLLDNRLSVALKNPLDLLFQLGLLTTLIGHLDLFQLLNPLKEIFPLTKFHPELSP